MNSNKKAVIREIPGNLGLVSYFHFGNLPTEESSAVQTICFD